MTNTKICRITIENKARVAGMLLSELFHVKLYSLSSTLFPPWYCFKYFETRMTIYFKTIVNVISNSSFPSITNNNPKSPGKLN